MLRVAARVRHQAEEHGRDDLACSASAVDAPRTELPTARADRPSREHPAFAILRRASIEPDFAGCEIHVPPLERQYLGGDPPAGNVRELHDRLQRSRQMRLQARELFGLKEARTCVALPKQGNV